MVRPRGFLPGVRASSPGKPLGPSVELGLSGAEEWDGSRLVSLFLCLTLTQQATETRDEEQSRCELPECRGRHGLLGSWAPPPSLFTHSENRKKLWGGGLCKGESPPPAHAVLSSSAHYSPVDGEDSTDHLGELDICPWQLGESGDS